eukprot:13873992-Ditylum_brightwellii.AAC.1
MLRTAGFAEAMAMAALFAAAITAALVLTPSDKFALLPALTSFIENEGTKIRLTAASVVVVDESLPSFLFGKIRGDVLSKLPLGASHAAV